MRKIYLIIALAWLALDAMAAPVTRQQARQWAQEFAANHGATLTGEPLKAPGIGRNVTTEPLYVFNTEGERGFVVIAGDDRAEAVVGYTTAGHYDVEALPPALKEWLQQCSKEIRTLGEIPDEVSAAARAPRHIEVHEVVAPLIKTQWNQGAASETGSIYNILTPTLNGKHTLTGCVATAGAQVMYYYQWPKTQTKEVPKYYWNSQKDSLDALPPITFSWDAMQTKYSSEDTGESVEAISKLMRYCGQAAKMDYGLDGSSAGVLTLVHGMVNCFDYDPHTWKLIERSKNTVATWDALIYNELSEGRPVIFSGSGFNGGHAFICDGYDGNGFYHFNWGWGGSYDGYFKLHVCDPYQGNSVFADGRVNNGYIADHFAYIGIQPNTGVLPTEEEDSWETPVADEPDTWEEEVIEGDVLKLYDPKSEEGTVSCAMYNATEQARKFVLGLGEMKEDGSLEVLYKADWYAEVELQPNQGWYFGVPLASLNLTEGHHTLVFICRENTSTEWLRCKPASTYLEVNVSGEDIQATVHPIMALEVTDIECTGSRMPRAYNPIMFTVMNNGDNYDGTINLICTTPSGDHYYGVPCKVAAGNTKRLIAELYTQEKGTYNILFATDWEGKNIIGQTQLEIKNGLVVNNMECTSSRMPNTSQVFTFDVENQGGNYEGYMYLYVSPTDIVKFSNSTRVKLKAGNTRKYTIDYVMVGDAGIYNVWLASNYSEDINKLEIVYHTTLDIDCRIKVDNIECAGNKAATIVQDLVATISSEGTECSLPLYLFASMTEAKGNAIYYAPTAIEAGGSEDVVFRFLPKTGGIWNIWICTDLAGTNVIGQTTVEIVQPSTEEIKLKLVGAVVEPGTTATATLSVKNTSAAAFYETLYVYLYEKDENNNWAYIDYLRIRNRTIAPDETQEIVFSFDDLEEAKEYRILTYYVPVFGSNKSSFLGEYMFTNKEVPTAIQQLSTASQTHDERVYNLQGQRVKHTTKGVYIVNGRKVIMH